MDNDNVTLADLWGSDPIYVNEVSALKPLQNLGVRRIVLDKLDEWQPEQAALQKRSRPDRALPLSRAAEYDRWVNAKVQSSRDDPRPAISEF